VEFDKFAGVNHVIMIAAIRHEHARHSAPDAKRTSTSARPGSPGHRIRKTTEGNCSRRQVGVAGSFPARGHR
jgi:hypothetical protein